MIHLRKNDREVKSLGWSEDPETCQHIYGHMTFCKQTKKERNKRGEKQTREIIACSTNGAGSIGHLHVEEWN